MCIVIASLVLGCFGDGGVDFGIDEGVAMCLLQGWSTSVHFGFGWVVDNFYYSLWFPIYWAYWNFRVCIICAFEITRVFLKVV